jgi:protein subunit release factor B
MKVERKPLFSVTKKDFKIQTFRSGGKGGQNQNKRDSGVRIIHEASGARGESREHKTQLANRKAAFKRLTESKKFKMWMKIEIGRRTQDRNAFEERVQRQVSQDMHPKNLKIEGKTEEGSWETLGEA